MRSASTMRSASALFAILVSLSISGAVWAQVQVPSQWLRQWPNTDFSRTAVDFSEIVSGGVPRDGIRSIDNPVFAPIAELKDLAGTEPVIGLIVNGVARAYPLQILTIHEIVNDVIGGVPVTVTFCPLCNTAIVFERTVNGRVLDFGVSGNLRNSDLIMYDRQTDTWWQQFTGTAIVGAQMGTELRILPSRLESWDNFRARAPEGAEVMVARSIFSSYGFNPYPGYDSSSRPFLYFDDLPDEIPALARVITIETGNGREAWSLDLLKEQRRIEVDGIVITWEPGQNSALGHALISQAADVGNVVVQQRTDEGLLDMVYGVDFAFAFRAFFPDAHLHQ